MSVQITSQEKVVLNVVQEYLDKNRCFNMTKIIPFINSRFRNSDVNLNNQAIESILNQLVKKNLIVTGSKLSKETVLKNEKREKIFNIILENPSIHFNKILKITGISYNVVIWHLTILQKFKFINKEKIGNRDIYFDFKLEFEDIEKQYYLNNKKCKEIIDFLKNETNGANKYEIEQNLSMHHNTVKKYLKKLEDLKLIKRISESNQVKYYFCKELIV